MGIRCIREVDVNLVDQEISGIDREDSSMKLAEYSFQYEVSIFLMLIALFIFPLLCVLQSILSISVSLSL